jgi:hypothetical protein
VERREGREEQMEKRKKGRLSTYGRRGEEGGRRRRE